MTALVEVCDDDERHLGRQVSPSSEYLVVFRTLCGLDIDDPQPFIEELCPDCADMTDDIEGI